MPASIADAPAATAAAYALDLAVGDPRRGHPVAAFGRLALALERAGWRPRRRAGTVHAVVLVGLAAGLVAGVDRRLGRRGRVAWHIACLWSTLGGRSLRGAAAAVAACLERKDVEGARHVVAGLVSRDVGVLDASGLARATIESLAENTADAIVGPLLWSAALGPAGAVAHRAVNTLDAMVGYRTPRYARFGWASARADDLANWPVARASVALVGLAAAADPRCSARGALQAAWADGRHHPSPNAGRVEAAFAGALGLRLGGPTSYGGTLEARAHLGRGRAPQPEDIHAAVRLSARVAHFAAVASALIAWRRGRPRRRATDR